MTDKLLVEFLMKMGQVKVKLLNLTISLQKFDLLSKVEYDVSVRRFDSNPGMHIALDAQLENPIDDEWHTLSFYIDIIKYESSGKWYIDGIVGWVAYGYVGFEVLDGIEEVYYDNVKDLLDELDNNIEQLIKQFEDEFKEYRLSPNKSIYKKTKLESI